ncbi:MAG: deoxyribonuclease V [Chloroflexota bacterium]|nr:deoxyribonuclease V [Chloroflexota bacterium]
MKAHYLHDWQVTPARAVMIQRELAGRISTEDGCLDVKLVAGVDISVSRLGGMGRGAVVVLRYPELNLVESQVAEWEIDFPYVPGLLSFREAPVLLAACEKLSSTPDLILVDGQGWAHPRRLGLASHLGLLWDKPTIGCAKSRLCGEHDPVGIGRGEFSRLTDRGEIIGVVLRTKTNVKPLYISPGHKISLESSIQWALNCGRGYRLPEPTRSLF